MYIRENDETNDQINDLHWMKARHNDSQMRIATTRMWIAYVEVRVAVTYHEKNLICPPRLVTK